jgi:hypothetical protein
MPAVYIASFHAALPNQSSPHPAYEAAIKQQAWPYDYGDDPSFFCDHTYGGPLSWGVCRGDVRNAIQPSDIVLFFSFQELEAGLIEYKLCAAATVEKKISQTDIWLNNDYSIHRQYLNVLIKPSANDGWTHHEPGLPTKDWHKDWLWRFVERRGTESKDWKDIEKYPAISFDERVNGRAVRPANNYVVFSPESEKTLVMRKPPLVAHANRGEPERWLPSPAAQQLRSLTLGVAQGHNASRCTLRTKNRQRSHPKLRWEMSIEEMERWRKDLFRVMYMLDDNTVRVRAKPASGKFRC